VVSLSGLDFAWRSHAIAAWWDLLAAHAFGNFRTLLEAVTLNPAMGYWLNTKGNQRENAATGRQPDENYAREVMQLMTIGLTALNADGTEQRDGQGNKRDSYTQDEVTNLARVFTGYDFDTSRGTTSVNGRNIPSTESVRLPMALNANRHSTLAASFLGTTIPANTPGAAALRTALDTLFNHPNVGPFFARQMIQRLVTSNPSPGYVARVAAAFANNGAGVRGDLGVVFGAVLLDDEARGPQGLASPSFAGASANSPTPPTSWARARCARPRCSTSSGRVTCRLPPRSRRSSRWRRSSRSSTKAAWAATSTTCRTCCATACPRTCSRPTPRSWRRRMTRGRWWRA
jgi:uncharacterized protein (DUF1800 family)